MSQAPSLAPPPETPYSGYDPLASMYDERWRFFVGRGLPVLDRLLLAGLEPGAALLDLCCGTGELALRLAGRGLRITGLDGSEAMLAVARAKVPGARFVHADARRFDLPGEFDAAVSTFDSLNHLLTPDELGAAFASVRRSLRPGGRFVFDLNLREGYRDRWNERSAEVDDRLAVFTRSSFDEDESLGRMELTVFDGGPECWRRRDVLLTQRCYAEEEVLALLRSAGFAGAGVEVQPRGSRLSGRGFFFAARSAAP